MNEMNPLVLNESSTEQAEKPETLLPQVDQKKQFVEPAISVPVDVLEATSFFQLATTISTGVLP